MTLDQTIILAVLAATAGLFLFGRWRHDMVAVAALLACVVAGLVPAGEAFAGFGHPAVVTVACVLVLSEGMKISGAVDAVSDRVLALTAGPTLTIAGVAGLAAVMSAFMNNVGALALLMPLAFQVAARLGLPTGRVLMPLAFGSILGGMTTLIWTPPNLIVSSFRAAHGGSSFSMFDFTPVGLAVAGVGIVFIALVGWRLVPARKGAGTEEFDAGTYLTEARIPGKSKAVGLRLREIEGALSEADAQVVGLVRNEVRVTAPNPARKVRAGDILVLEADPKALTSALSLLDLELEEAVPPDRAAPAEDGAPPYPDDAGPGAGSGPDETFGDGSDDEIDHGGDDAPETGPDTHAADDIVLVELAVLPGSSLPGQSATDIRLRTVYGLNLLAISRQGRRSMARLRTTTMRAGDVLLVQGPPDAIAEFAAQHGCAPLAERTIRIPNRRQALTGTAIMVLAVSGAAFDLLPAAIAFAAGVLACMVFRVVPPRRVYEAIDWPVIVLLGALIPVAGAMSTTGAADLVARLMLEVVAQGHAVVALAVILVVTMTLSDFMNNAATAAVMCPIAIGTAGGLGVSSDPFLIAVAVGASCAFLTPIGHQNNTLILGPRGFVIEAIVVAVGVPMILLVWPL
jgi:di/tricarboxylate transporter